MSVEENNKRIAKNTLLLYFRMLLILGVSLYTVRIVLETLGEVDYGLYNVIAGIVAMFGFISNSMATATQRFFSFELGQNNHEKLNQTFSVTVIIYTFISILIVVLAETIGLWFMKTQMTIPLDRVEAANWVYQFAILSFVVTIMSIPYNAAIIAHENMKIYAYVSIIEVTLKLAIVYLLVIFSYDKLKLYSILMFGTVLTIRLIYQVYCRRRYSETKFQYYWDNELFKELVGFSGWNLFGTIAIVLKNHGMNILLNMFFGPIINAARGIAFQVNMAINQFARNFLTATKPQMTKYYAQGEVNKMLDLVYRTSKFAFYLLLMLSLPILLETKFILSIWLNTTPEYAVLFTRLVIVTSIVDSLSYSLMSAAQSSGKIRNYQMIVGTVMILNLPISYTILKLGYGPDIPFYLSILNSLICLLIRLNLLNKMIGLSIKRFVIDILMIISSVTLLAYILPLIVLFSLDENIARLILVCISSVISCIAVVYILGITVEERKDFNIYIKEKLKK